MHHRKYVKFRTNVIGESINNCATLVHFTWCIGLDLSSVADIEHPLYIYINIYIYIYIYIDIYRCWSDKRKVNISKSIYPQMILNLIYHHHHHHHVVPLARISLTLSRHFSLSFIAFGRSSGLHPVSSHSCCMYLRPGRFAFAWPYAGIHRSTSLMSFSLLLQQCPMCPFRLTCIVFMGGKWPYRWGLVGCCRQDLFNICSQHSWVIAV